MHEADDFFGHAVNYAARVASAAAGGEIRVSRLVHDLLVKTGDFEFDEGREVELKGFGDAERVYAVAGSDEPGARANDVCPSGSRGEHAVSFDCEPPDVPSRLRSSWPRT